MSQILIIYSSRYGQTAKICFQIARNLQVCGLLVDTVDIQTPLPLSITQYDGIIVGTPIYLGRSNSDLIAWVFRNRKSILKKVTGFFTVSLNAADARQTARADDQRLIKEFTQLTDWSPNITASFSGALHYPDYNFFLKFLMKRISKSAGGPTDTSQKFEMTDWKKVDSFTEKFIELINTKNKIRLHVDLQSSEEKQID